MNSEYRTIKAIPVSREVGAEISGVDIAAGISDEQFSELKQAFSDYGVIFLRDQDITPDQHIEFARRWGAINVNRFFQPVNGDFTVKFEDWTKAESQPLLDFLCQHASQNEFTCRFQWQKASMAIWDNRATQHYAMNDYQGELRLMHRITIEGEALDAAD